MDWRLIVALFVIAVGFGVGWAHFNTIAGAVLSVVFVSALFTADWLIDKYVYGL